MKYPETPDARYFISKNRLWRKTNPALDEETRQAAVNELMDARRKIAEANRNDDDALRIASRQKVQKAKVRLGERGPVWWDDGAEDQSRLHPKNSSYAAWWESLDENERALGAE